MVEENDNIELPPGDDDEESPLHDDTFHQGEDEEDIII